ncbi:hypothetical protein TNCV_335102 [Trichonephila clavipes]|nr:hypothetical protein TNCV_335102 [Trichonephila clavipes]
MLWLTQQRTFAVETYFPDDRSVIAVQRVYRRHFDIPPQGHNPDWKWVLRRLGTPKMTDLSTTGNVSKERKGPSKTARTPENMERARMPIQTGNRDYTGMWVRLGSTDLMAGKVMFLRSNQGGRFDGNESVADSFRSDLVNFKSSCTTILGAFYSFFVCQKNPPLSGSSPATRGQSHPSLSPSFKAK